MMRVLRNFRFPRVVEESENFAAFKNLIQSGDGGILNYREFCFSMALEVSEVVILLSPEKLTIVFILGVLS